VGSNPYAQFADPGYDPQNQKNFVTPSYVPDTLTAGPPGGQQTVVGPDNFNQPSLTTAPPPASPAPPAVAPNREVRDNNFAGMRIPGVNAGPEANGFQKFDTPQQGISAIGHQLDLYQDRDKLNTLSGIISKWAPPNENDTSLLIKRAAEWTGLDPSKPLDIHDPATRAKVITAMIRNEQGGNLPVDPSLIAQVTGADTNNPFAQFKTYNTTSDKLKIDPAALTAAGTQKNTSVVWMPAQDYLDTLTKDDNTPGQDKAKRQSLLKSLNAGDPLYSIPTMEVKQDGQNLSVIDYDGRHRVEQMIKSGYDYVPVALHGVDPVDASTIKNIKGMAGSEQPFNFPAVHIPQPPPQTGLARQASEAIEALPSLRDIGQGIKDVGQDIAGLGGQAAMSVAGLPPQASPVQPTDTGALAALGTFATSGLTNSLFPEVGMAGPAASAMPSAARDMAAGPSAVEMVGGLPQPQILPQGIGGLTGAAAPAAATATPNAARMLPGIVTPKALTQAAIRLLGEKAVDKITPKLLDGVRKKIGATLEKIEKSHDIVVDEPLLSTLADVDQKARDLLGAERQPISNAIEDILSRSQDGIIPGKSAATLWHQGSRLDNLTNSANPDIAKLAQQAQTAVRDALNRQLPPDVAKEYSDARSMWRDYKIVQKSIPLGSEEIDPRKFVGQVNKRFPNQASTPPGSSPPMLSLGRTANQMWGSGRRGPGWLPTGLGILLGESLAPGMGGGLMGYGVGHAVANRLADLRLTRNAQLRPPSPPSSQPNMLRQMMTPTNPMRLGSPTGLPVPGAPPQP
jgi:hypothetical protein